jgi:hypothetical protein
MEMMCAYFMTSEVKICCLDLLQGTKIIKCFCVKYILLLNDRGTFIVKTIT